MKTGQLFTIPLQVPTVLRAFTMVIMKAPRTTWPTSRRILGKSKLLLAILIVSLSAPLFQCTYLFYTVKHRGYQNKFKKNHLAGDLKHLLTGDTHFVYGSLKTSQKPPPPPAALAVAVFSRSNYGDLVEVCHFVQQNSFYGFNLPQGDFTMVALADRNRDHAYDQSEIIALKDFSVNDVAFSNKVGNVDLIWGEKARPAFDREFTIAVEKSAQVQSQSLFYPKGTIREFTDPIFARNTSKMGIYAPAAFVEKAPLMFYSLEEDMGHKIPIVFVHGIGGTPREFQTLIEGLDRERFKPWFFYYPSGADLDKLASLFYEIYLSGNVVPTIERLPLVVVAHSMGGLVVRQAINHYRGKDKESRIKVFISIASPFGGHADAARGIEKAPLVIPSWRDLDPSGEFIDQLFQKPPPSFVAHHFALAKLDGDAADDGVVSFASQSKPEALSQAASVETFFNGHAAILQDPSLSRWLSDILEPLRPDWPESHDKWLNAGGFQVTLPAKYSAKERYAIKNYGLFMRAMVQRVIQPSFPPQQKFVDVAMGRIPPSTFVESAWLKFAQDFPELAFAPSPKI